MIKFGTDGWRALTDKDFNETNVKRVSEAISKYVYETFGLNKKIIIGFDPRRKADFFAKMTAEIFKSKGFEVLLSSKVVATPIIAYNAGLLNACALMFTASHNPPEYLGIKFIPDYAGPATDDITSKIVENIDKFFQTEKEGSITETDFEHEYEKHIESLIDFERIKNSGIKVNYDALHGAAGKFFVKILEKHGIPVNAENLDYDSNFGGKLPEPSEKFLTELKETCKKTYCPGFSNDGDGDRFALVDEKGRFVSANKVIALLTVHLFKNLHKTGKLAKTVAGSAMLDLVAEKYSIDVIETAVGFKNLGQAVRENDVLIAGEESGGLTFKGHIPEKDGIAANLKILEALAYFDKTAAELSDEFDFGFVNIRDDISLPDEDFAKNALEKFKILDKIGEMKIARKNPIDGLKLYFSDNKTCILIRKSGTEPLFRIYFESDDKSKIEKLQTEIKKLISSVE